MVYLSANGEMIGQFDEGELPTVLAAGTIPPESFFWREGMPEWRPLRELVLPPRPRQAAPVSKLKPAPRPAAAVSVGNETPAPHPAALSAGLVERGAPREIAPALAKRKIFTPRAIKATDDGVMEDPASTSPAVQPLPAKPAPVAPRKPAKRGRKGLLFLLLIPLLAALGASAWWFFPVQPPALQGEVRLSGPDGALAPVAGAAVLLVSQQELAAQWRERLAEAQSRAAEVDELLKQAKAAHREKALVLELAARTSELGDEYNMPDAAELRAARDAAQAEEATALAEVEKLTREKESATDPAAVLRSPPEAIDQTQTDEAGAFQLLLPEAREGLVVLVVSGTGEEDASAVKGWLVPLDGAEERTEPARLSSDNALDADQIKQIAGAQP